MGLPVVIRIRITTIHDSRTVEYLGGSGLKSLAIGAVVTSDIHLDVIEDTADLPDGTYTLGIKHVRPGHFYYKWLPVENTEDKI